MVHNDHANFLLNIETPEYEYESVKSNKKSKKQRKQSSKYKSNVTNFPTPKNKTNNRAVIESRTPTQKYYLKLLDDISTFVLFGVGPAGTGKTYIASKWAANAFLKGIYDKIIIIRPMVTAGEDIGFLPGNINEKLSPILASVLDPLEEVFGKTQLDSLINLNKIEIAPLGFLRGRTFTNAVVIFDEAQNAKNKHQMKMLLTRLGEGSKIIITGDIEQTDVGTKNGLLDFIKRYSEDNIKGISIVNFEEKDIVRHHLISEILKLYEDIDS